MHIERLDDALVQVYSAWSPSRRLKAAADQSRFVRRMFRAQIASLNPDWDVRQVDAEVARRFLGNTL